MYPSSFLVALASWEMTRGPRPQTPSFLASASGSGRPRFLLGAGTCRDFLTRCRLVRRNWRRPKSSASG
eukprot:9427537-Pyramimonas_sp.AAC.1